MDDEGMIPDVRRQGSKKSSNMELKKHRGSIKRGVDINESLRSGTKKKSRRKTDRQDSFSGTKTYHLKSFRPGSESRFISKSPSLLNRSTKDVNEAYYEEVGGDLAMACEILSDHEQDIIWKVADVITAIPADYPPRRYTNKLCCHNTCCMRCCTNTNHKETRFHTALKTDATTDVPDEIELMMSGSDTSMVSLTKLESTFCDLAEFTDESKPVALRAVEAARKAKRAIRAAKQFRTASKTVQSLECNTDSEQRMRRQYTRDLMERAVTHAKMARDELAKYRILKKAVRKNPEMVAQIAQNKDVASLESLLSQDGKSLKGRTATSEGHQMKVAAQYASAPNIVYGGYIYDTTQADLPGAYPLGSPSYDLTLPRLPSPGLHQSGLPQYGLPPSCRHSTSAPNPRPAVPGTRYRGSPYGQPYGPLIGQPLSHRQPASFPDPDYGGSKPRRTSAPEVHTWWDRSTVLGSAATLVRGADKVINKACQAADEANKLQRISAAMLFETRALESSGSLSQRSERQPPYDRPVKNSFLSVANIPSDGRGYHDDMRSLNASGQEGPCNSRFAGAAQSTSNRINKSDVDSKILATDVEPQRNKASPRTTLSTSSLVKKPVRTSNTASLTGWNVETAVPFKAHAASKANLMVASAVPSQPEPSARLMQPSSQLKPSFKVLVRKGKMSAQAALQLQEKLSEKGQARFSDKLPTMNSQRMFKSLGARRVSVGAGLALRMARRPSDETAKMPSQELTTEKTATKRESIIPATDPREKPIPKTSSVRRASVDARQLLREDVFNATERRKLNTGSRDLAAAVELFSMMNLPLAAEGEDVTPVARAPKIKGSVRSNRSESVITSGFQTRNITPNGMVAKSTKLEGKEMSAANGRQVVKITLPLIIKASKKVGTSDIPIQGRQGEKPLLCPRYWLSAFCGPCANDTKRTQDDIDEGVASEPCSTKRTKELSEQPLDIERTPSQRSKSMQMSSSQRSKSSSSKETHLGKRCTTFKRDSSSYLQIHSGAKHTVPNDKEWKEFEDGVSKKNDDDPSVKKFEETPESDKPFKSMPKRCKSINVSTQPEKKTQPFEKKTQDETAKSQIVYGKFSPQLPNEKSGFGNFADPKIAMATPRLEDENLLLREGTCVSLLKEPSQDMSLLYDISAQVIPMEDESDQKTTINTASRLSKMKAADPKETNIRAIDKYERKKEKAAKNKLARESKGKYKASVTGVSDGNSRSIMSRLSKQSTKNIKSDMLQENAALGQLCIPEEPKVLPSETYVLAFSTNRAAPAVGDAKISQLAPNIGHLITAEPLNETSKDKKERYQPIENKPAQLNRSFMEGQRGAKIQPEIKFKGATEKVSGEITKEIPGVQKDFSEESAVQVAVALESATKGAPEVGRWEISMQAVQVGPPSKPVLLRGTKGQDIHFLNLNRAARLYPESYFVVALSAAGVLWVLFIMFTTVMNPSMHPLPKIAPNPVTVSPRTHFLIDKDINDFWAPMTITNTTEDMTMGMTITEEATSQTHPRSFYACDTSYCEQESSYLRSLLTGDPCKNFYNYACKMQTSLWKPNFGSSVSRDTLLENQAETLATGYILDNSHHEMKVANDFLKACTDHGDSDSWHRMEMNELFFEYFGSTWPVDNKPVTPEGVWVMAGRLARDLKLEAFAAVSIDVHPEKKAIYIIGIDEPSLLYRDGDWTMKGYATLVTRAIEQSITFMNTDANVGLHISNIQQTMELLAKLVAGPTVRNMGVENYRLSKVRLLVPGVRAFLRTVFLDTATVMDGTDVMVKSPLFFERLEYVEKAEFNPTNLLNYLGFRVMVYFGTFLQQRFLRELRAIETGISYQENTELERLCAREVERILPAFYLRAYSLQMTHISLLIKSWTSKLERTFIRGLPYIAWMQEPGPTTVQPDSDMRMAKYKILSHKIKSLIPAWVLQNASFQEYHRGLLHHLEVSLNLNPSNILKRFRFFVRLLQRECLRVPHRAKNMSSIFDTEASYDVQRKKLYVPIAVINASVPANSTAFVVHIARYGIRIFKALIPALYQDYVYEANQHDQGPLLYTDGYQERLHNTMQCLLSQYDLLAGQLKSSFLKGSQDLASAGLAILEQTLALQQAYWTFQKLLNIKRIWRTDFRLAGLPQLSSEQLFFVAYAIDNCEASDDVFRRHRFQTTYRLPPEDRVNFPLSQLEAFAQAFSCNRDSPMIGRKHCPVFLNAKQSNM